MMKNENIFFIRKLLRNPRSVGAIAPSSKKLGAFMSRHIKPGEKVIELGAGTGGLTKALLASGMDLNNLILVELDKDMCKLLHAKFPGVTIVQGCATRLPELMEEHAPHMREVQTIISGIPMVNLNFVTQESIMRACFSVLDGDGRFLQFTYGPKSPIPYKKMNLSAQRLGSVFQNVPPAIIWQYMRGANVNSPADDVIYNDTLCN